MASRTIKIIPILAALAISAAAVAGEPLQRVVSLDYCADQYVLKLLPRSSILALSPDAEGDFSYMRADAAGIPTVRATAEDVLILQPNVIVRSYGGGPNAAAFFARVGIPVIQVPYARDIDGIRAAVLSLAASFGVTERGVRLVAEMDARLARLVKPGSKKSALYMTPGGATSGAGTMIHEMLQTAGLENFQTQPGWRTLPLERLAYEQPDLIAAAFFNSAVSGTAAWSPMRHPVARRQLLQRPSVAIPGSATACGAWFLLDAIEALNTAANDDEAAF